ncbi:hypothetical protein CP556_17425 [Natrinema sp. CBA1119]|nr:hypothetical protein CP556_17425 [Natrinema sp. CBA1119]
MIPVRTGVPGYGPVHDRYGACLGRSVTGLEVTLDRVVSDRPTAVRITKDGAGTERRSSHLSTDTELVEYLEDNGGGRRVLEDGIRCYEDG